MPIVRMSWRHAWAARPWASVVIATLSVAAALLLRVLFQPWLGLTVPYLFFFPTIMWAALFGGYTAGILSTVLSAISAAYFFLNPAFSLEIANTADVISLGLFAAIGWAISHLAESRREFEREYRESAAIAETRARDLEATTRRMNEVVANVPGVVWEAWGRPDTPTQRIDFVSDYVKTMLGYGPSEWTAVPNFWLTVVHPDDRERAAAEAAAIFAGRREPRSEFRWVHRDGRAVWVEAHSTVIRDAAGRPLGMRGVTLDVTSRKQLERDLAELLVREQQAREDAVRANRLKDDFLATLSHELRTPLNAVLGYLHMLRTGAVLPAQREHALQVVERNAALLAQMVADVLDVSRIAVGKIRLNIEMVNVGEVVTAAMNTIRPAADAKGVRLSSSVPDDTGALSADPERLQQILWNLLSNAVRFTPRGGKVQATVRRFDTYVEIAVIDTGVGIASDFLPHVFERFRQADTRVARDHGGLGLGLAITRDLVEMHGGTIHAYSAGPDQGSTFRVVLPAAEHHSATDDETERAS